MSTESIRTPRVVVPPAMSNIHEEYGYAPAIAVGGFVFCAGQVGRTADLEVIADPEAQFRACWANLVTVLAEAGCGLEHVIDLTSYHVELSQHFDLFKRVKNEIFPRKKAAWTAIGVSNLARPGLLLELKATAYREVTP